MRLPARPPRSTGEALSKIVQKHPSALDAMVDSGLVRPHSGEAYHHWDDFRRRPPPVGMTAEDAWILERFRRRLVARPLPLTAEGDQPFTWTETPSLARLLHAFDLRAGGEITLPVAALNQRDAERYLFRSLIEEPFSSSLIEGAATTREIARELIEAKKTPSTISERMVLNNYYAMQYVKRNRERDLSIDMLFELQEIITDGTLENRDHIGRLRTTNEVRVVDMTTGEILHQPPDYKILQQRLDRLIAFVNDRDHSNVFLHPLIKAITLHFMIGYEHPFGDGNGRTARALFYWYMLKSGYWILEYTSISKVISESALSYERAFLLTETDDFDLTYFILDQARVLEKAMAQLWAYAERKRDQNRQIEALIATQLSNKDINVRQRDILTDFVLGRVREYRIDDVKQRYGVSYLTARKDLEDLAAEKLLTKTADGPRNVYRPGPKFRQILSNAGSGGA